MTTEVETPANHSRRKIFRIPHHAVLGIARTIGIQPNESVYLHRPYGLPDGVKVLGVSSNYQNQCFDFIIEHPSFEAIPDCQSLPVEKLNLELYRVGKVDDRAKVFQPESFNAATPV